MSDIDQITIDSDIKINSFINKEPGTGHHKFIVKIRDLLEGMSHEVQDFIFRECDNESVSEVFKREVRKTMSQILESYISKLG
jgi:nucleoside-triphosphatase THEP1